MKSGTGEECNRSKSENPTLGWEAHQLSWQTDCSISLDNLTKHKVGKLFPFHCSGRKVLPLLSFSWQSVPSCWKPLCLLPSDSSLNNFRSQDLSLQVNFSGPRISLITHLWTQNLQVSRSVVDWGHAGLSAYPIITFLLVLLLVRELS